MSARKSRAGSLSYSSTLANPAIAGKRVTPESTSLDFTRDSKAANYLDESFDGKASSQTLESAGSSPLSIPFPQSFELECIQGSAIALDQYQAAVRFTEDTGRWAIHDLLNWEIRPNWQTRKPWNPGSFAGFHQETGEIWQGKPERMPQGMGGKYLAPKGIGSQAFLPALAPSVRKALSLPIDGSGWDAIAANPSIPIILTEGGKKALCGLSHGHAAIAGFGVDAFTRKGENQLLPELLPFIHPKRRWVIAFDEDSKRSTRRRVRKATARLGRLLVAAGVSPENISIAQWEPAQGKGLDDLVVQSGANALHQAIAQAMPFPAWKRGGWDAYLKGKYPELFGLTHAPAITLNQRYLPALGLPLDGGILALSSAMGTGKTEAMKALIDQAKGIDPNCLIELIGYRNSLGKQSAQRLKLDHIHDLQGTGYAQTLINTTSGLAYCLDSLHRRIKTVLAAIANGRRVLVLLDEIDAVLKHLFLGSTLGRRRGEIMMMFCELLQAVSNSGGWIVCGEADLTSLPIAFLEAITGKTAQVVINEWQGNPWKIEAPMPTNDEGEDSPGLMGPAAIARIIAELAMGKRAVAPTDSQRWGNLLERAAIAQGYEVTRLDGETSEEPWAHELMEDPDAFLEQEKPQLFIYTPTAESGLSITGNHFDVMVAYASHLEHRAIMQLMGRVRADIPRAIYCRKFSLSDESGRQSDPEALLIDWKLNARYSAMAAKLGDDAPCLDLDGIELLLHEFAAKYDARINGSQAQLRASLLTAMEAQGHIVTQHQELPIDQAFKHELKAIREDMDIEQAEEFATADISAMTLAKAHSIITSSSSKREERVPAQKVLTLDVYPGLPVDDADFVLRNITKSRGRKLRQHTALFMVMKPEVAQAVDRLCWKEQASNQILWLPSIKREAPKALLTKQSGLLEVFKLGEYQEDSPEVQRVRNFAIHYQADIKRVLGLWCAPSHTGVQIVNKLARSLGMTPQIDRKIGSRGAQIKVWKWCSKANGDRAAIHAALAEKWADVLSQVPPVASISDKENPITKVEATEAETLTNQGGQLVAIDGDAFRLKRVEGDIAYLAPVNCPDAPDSLLFEAPKGELQILEVA